MNTSTQTHDVAALRVELSDSGLSAFMEDWQTRYKAALESITLFQPRVTATWTAEKKAHFAKVFYHLRGHFNQFLWYMGNHAPNPQAKEIVLSNIAEEFSINGRSHELLYYDFAKEVGVDIEQEIQTGENYLPFAVSFNAAHLQWLREHDWNAGFAAFSAYEKLDNVDYEYLYQMAESFGLSKRALTFFAVHRHVDHFDNTREVLLSIWQHDPDSVRAAFDFIGSHQIQMWNDLDKTLR